MKIKPPITPDGGGGALGRIGTAEKFSDADEKFTFQVPAEGAHVSSSCNPY